MGRTPTKTNLPPKMRARVRGDKTYYTLDLGGRPRKELSLGSDYIGALKRYAELMVNANAPKKSWTIRDAAQRYLLEIVPSKAPRTQRDNAAEMAKILEFFGHPEPAPLDAIRPLHIRQYMDWRKDAPIRATREKALFSHMFNMAREWGYTDAANPAAGIKGKTSHRDVYVDDATYHQVYASACQPLRDAMDLAYLTGQRPADMLSMKQTDIKDDALWLQQGKTGKRLRISIEGELSALLARIAQRKAEYAIHTPHLIVNEQGQPLTAFALRSRFDKAREVAGVNKADFQFKDLRAKAATEKAAASGSEAAKDQLGHESVEMTRKYIRNRLGALVKPTK